MNTAAIDIGSNSVRLLISDATGAEIVRDTTVTALGSGVDATGRFRDDTMGATLDVMGRYADAISAHGAARVRVVATSASRDAENGARLMDAISEVLGVSPEIISGDVEAELSFAGAMANSAGDPPYLVVDIGGGSTEFVFGVAEPARSASIDIGSVRLTDRVLPDRPPSDTQLRDASAQVDSEFSAVELPGTPGTVIGVAGTFTSLAAIALGLERYDREAIHGTELSRATIKELIDELSTLTVSETAAIPSLDPKRAPVILAGAVIADRAMLVAGTDTIVVSEYGLLHGLSASLTPDP